MIGMFPTPFLKVEISFSISSENTISSIIPLCKMVSTTIYQFNSNYINIFMIYLQHDDKLFISLVTIEDFDIVLSSSRLS